MMGYDGDQMMTHSQKSYKCRIGIEVIKEHECEGKGEDM